MARRYPFVFIFIVTALLVCSAYYLHFPYNLRYDTEADYLDSLAAYRVQVLEPPVRKSNGGLTSVRLISMYQADTVRLLSQHALLYFRTDSLHTPPQMGDVALVRTRITRPGALFVGEFDYGDYLRLQHLVGIGYVPSNQWQVIGHAPLRTLRAYAASAQQRLVQRLTDAGLSGRPLALIAAITLGERDALDSGLRQSFAAAGAAHVLAVSGLHTGIIYSVIILLLTCFYSRRPLYEQRLQRALLSLCVITLMWAYAFLTGLSPSVMRAVLMITIVQVGWVLRRHGISFNTLAAAACICLWADPLSLFSVSFQLSFAAVVGIMLFVPYLHSVWVVKGHLLKRFFLRDIFTISIAATIGTLPVCLYYFGQMSHCFLLTNLVVLPAAYILVIMGIAVLVLAHTGIGVWLAGVLQCLGSGVCTFIGWVEHLPLSTLQMHATPWMVVCLVVAIACCYLRIRQKRLLWFMPAVAAVAIFCVLHIHDMHQCHIASDLAIRGRTIYYYHNGTIDRYAATARYTFFGYNGGDYVYAPYLPEYSRQALEQFCQEHGITVWENK